MIYKTFKHPNYNVIGILNDKFKSCEIEVFFRKNITKHDLSERILLSDTMIYMMQLLDVQSIKLEIA